jgi:hypothetical protein
VRLNLYALCSKKNDQSADRQCRHEIVATRDSLGEPQDSITFKGTSITQHGVLVDVRFNLALQQRTKRDIRNFHGGQHSPGL